MLEDHLTWKISVLAISGMAKKSERLSDYRTNEKLAGSSSGVVVLSVGCSGVVVGAEDCVGAVVCISTRLWWSRVCVGAGLRVCWGGSVCAWVELCVVSGVCVVV